MGWHDRDEDKPGPAVGCAMLVGLAACLAIGLGGFVALVRVGFDFVCFLAGV